MTFPKLECGSGINNTLYDLWLNRTCGGSHYFQALPANWTNSLQLVDNKTYVLTSEINYPSCITDSNCYSSLNATQWNFTSIRCNLSGDSCSSISNAVDVPQFCEHIAYGKTCNESCQLSWQRADLLEWMNKTCNTTQNWNGLPRNWTLLLVVLESELMPWAPIIEWNSSNVKVTNETLHPLKPPRCPSNGAKLGVFAVVNIVST